MSSDFTHGICVVDPNTEIMIQFVSFWNEPTATDYLSIYRELKQNGLDEFVLIPASEKTMELIRNEIEEGGAVLVTHDGNHNVLSS